MHVRGYKEKGNINTPMELAINNEIDRFSLAIDAIDRVPRLQKIGGPREGEIPQSADRMPGLRVQARHRQPGDYRMEVPAPLGLDLNECGRSGRHITRAATLWPCFVQNGPPANGCAKGF